MICTLFILLDNLLEMHQKSTVPLTDVAPVWAAVHTSGMRANLNLDADVYTFASTYASAKGIPLGAAISELLRKVEHKQEASALLTESRLGLLIRAKQEGEKVVTPEMVKALSENDFD